MCGITGYVGLDDPTLLRSMCESLRHRGPDEEGIYTSPGMGLAMRRLSIIDLTTGHQPIANEDRTVWVVLNGEIYNYQELRDDLVARGHRFSTTSDTETIVHLYEEHGVDFPAHLRGMFAVALWDEPRQRMVLVRDRIGEKPLYYTCSSGRLAFASEVNALLWTIASRRPDHGALGEFLAVGYIPRDRTAFDGVHKLAPAHRLVFERGSATVDRYWQRARPATTPSFATATDRLRGTLDDTVRVCLRSDVEVGALLSGGLDSSVLTALMRRHSAHVHTFTVGFTGGASGFNETAEARRVSELLGTEHHEITLRSQASLDLMPTVLSHFGEPNGEPTAILVYELSRFVRRHVKVAVGGTGGDEVFFGYPRHRGLRFLEYYRLLPRVVRRHLVERLVSRWPESTRGSRFAKRAKRFVLGADRPPAEAYLAWVRLLDRDVHHALIGRRLAGGGNAEPAECEGDGFLRAYLTGETGSPLLDRVAALDVDGYLPEYQLTYVDRMSMAHGLEVRSPLCDYQLVDFVMGLPPGYRLRGTRSKHLLKTVAKSWLPADIINRKKVGFDSPIGQWLKDELRPFLLRFLDAEHVRRSGLLDPSAVQTVIHDHLSGRRDYSLQLWSILMVEAWYRMYVERSDVNPASVRLQDLRGAEAEVGGDQPRGEDGAP